MIEKKGLIARKNVNINKKGSILAFSLIILAMMLTIAISTASFSVIQKKNASSTESSVQSYQVADGSALWALKKVNVAIYNNALISSQFSSSQCSNGVFSGSVSDISSLPASASFDISFLKADGTTIVGCTDQATSIEKIKAVGKFQGTVRAVEISVAALPGAVAWWKMDESSWNGTSGEVIDSSTGGHNGTSVGGASTVAGKFSNAGNFNGSSGYLDMGGWFNYQAFTISMWLKPGSSQVQWADIIDNNHAGSPANRNWVFQQNDSNTNNYNFGTIDASGTDCNVSNIILDAGTWQNVVIVRNSSSLSVYKNGSLVGSSTTNCSNPVNYSNQNLRLGSWGGGGRYWNGLMDDVRIYDKALSADQVALLYSSVP